MDMRTDNWSGTATRPVGLIIRQKGPNNLEMPFDQLGDFITPSELFYIRSHFPAPELDPLAYRLSISGGRANCIQNRGHFRSQSGVSARSPEQRCRQAK